MLSRSLSRLMSAPPTPIYDAILTSLHASFPTALHLSATNESSGHNVPPNSETHFLVTVVTPAFDGVSRLGRHRAVNDALRGQLEDGGGVHALRIAAKSGEEWEGLAEDEREAVAGKAPSCRGGDGSLPER